MSPINPAYPNKMYASNNLVFPLSSSSPSLSPSFNATPQSRFYGKVGLRSRSAHAQVLRLSLAGMAQLLLVLLLIFNLALDASNFRNAVTQAAAQAQAQMNATATAQTSAIPNETEAGGGNSNIPPTGGGVLAGAAGFATHLTAPFLLTPGPVCPTQTATLTPTLTYLGATTSSWGNALGLAALLTDPSGNPLASNVLTFTLSPGNGSGGSPVLTTSATTDANGFARTIITPTTLALPPGAATLKASWPGSTSGSGGSGPSYTPVTLSQAVTLTLEPTIISYTGNGLPGLTAPAQPVSAKLLDAFTGLPIVGVTLSFSLGSAPVVSATTDATGTASATLALTPDQAIGQPPLVVRWAGDTFRQASSLSVPSSFYLDSAFGTVVVRHAPNFSSNARVTGSIRQLLPEYDTLNTGVVINGDLLVPGSPSVQRNGSGITFGGTVTGTGSASPSNYSVSLNDNTTLGHLVIRTDAVTLSAVPAPPTPTGTRDISINGPGDTIGDPSTLRNITLNTNAGAVALPPGTYGTFSANTGSSYVLGITGTITPVVYNVQGLSFNGTASLSVVGPIILNTATGFSFGGLLGNSAQPLWLEVNASDQSGITLNTGATFYGVARSPSGGVTLNGGTTLKGSVFADRLSFNSGSVATIQGVSVPTSTTTTAPVLAGSLYPAGSSPTAPTGPVILPGSPFNWQLAVTNTTSGGGGGGSGSATSVVAGSNFPNTLPTTRTTTISSLLAAGGASTTATLTETVASFTTTRQTATESSPAYQTRLGTQNGVSLWGRSLLTWGDTSDQAYVPLNVLGQPTPTEGLPLLSLGLSTPAGCAVAGSVLTYTVRVSNVGSAAAQSGTVGLTYPDATTGSLSFGPLAVGGVYTGSLTWSVPASTTQSSVLTTKGQVNWQDGATNPGPGPNSYGPVEAQLLTSVGTNGGGNAGPGSVAPASGTPQSTGIGTLFPYPFGARVLDTNGQPLAGVAVFFQAPTSGPSGAWAGGFLTTTVNTDNTGLATTPAFAANALVGSYNVTATVSGVITPALFSLTNQAVPNRLVFTQNPAGAVAGSPFITGPVVTVLNTDGTTATTYSGAVSLIIKSGTGTAGAILSGTTTLAAGSGVASFTNLSIDRAGTGYVLSAASGSLTGADSTPFTVTTPITNGGQPASIRVIAGTPQSTPINTAFTTALQAQVLDSSSQPVSGTVVTFQSPPSGSGPGGTFSGGGAGGSGSSTSVTATTGSNGVATAPTFVANGTVGSYNVSASVSGVITPAIFTLSNTNPVVPPPTSGDYSLELVPLILGPEPLGSIPTMTVKLIKHGVVVDPAPPSVRNVPVQFVVQGANSLTRSAVTDNKGEAQISYQGNTIGTDNIQASATLSGTQIRSNVATIYWSQAVTNVVTTPLVGQFFSQPESTFNFFAPTDPPIFTKTFPVLNFNPAAVPPGTPNNLPPEQQFCTNIAPCPVFNDVVVDANGNFQEVIPASSASGVYTAGVGSLLNFKAEFTAQLVISQAGPISFTILADDSYIMGMANGATRLTTAAPDLGGLNISTTFAATLPIVAAHNSGPATDNFVINFPAPGIYSYEIDYAQSRIQPDPYCFFCSYYDDKTLVMLANGAGVPAVGRLTLTPTGDLGSKDLTLSQTFTATATNAIGQPAVNVPVTLVSSGSSVSPLRVNTDATGTAVFNYKGQNLGPDTLMAQAWLGAQVVLSKQATITWTAQPVSQPNTCFTNAQIALPGWISTTNNAPSLTISTPLAISLNMPGNSAVLKAGAKVQYWPANDSTKVTDLLTTNSDLPNGTTLATFDTTSLPDGSYVIRLIGTDGNNQCQANQILVVVTGDYKPGRVRFSLTDLTVPVAGLPIQIVRTYDSLDRTKSGDFGFGWSLGIGTPRLEVNPAGDVTLTQPGGKRVTFFFHPDAARSDDTFLNNKQINFLGFLLLPQYLPEAGEYGTFTADTNSACNLVVAISSGYSCFSLSTPQFYKDLVVSYSYTDPYGRVYTFARDGTLKTLRDLKANVLTFGPDGITSSNGGRKVSFVRDAANANRITSIIDPANNQYRYDYNGSGDLQYVTLPTLASEPTSIITYSYATAYPHLFEGEQDARGKHSLLNQYYTVADGALLNGRLKSVIDAGGNTTRYDYNLNTRIVTTTWPDGGITTNLYYPSGRDYQVIDQLGRITTRTGEYNPTRISQTDQASTGNSTTCYSYDSKGRVSGQSDPALDCTTLRTTLYNYYGGPVLITEKSGITKTVDYDEDFMVSGSKDAKGYIGGYQYDNHGNILTQFDGKNKATNLTYDQYGNKRSESDALGRTVYYSYDDLGRVVSSTNPASSPSRYEYDPLGQLTAMTVTLNSNTNYVMRYQYDANGNKTKEIGPDGAEANFTYDDLNHLTYQVTPDGAITSYLYDWRGKVLTRTISSSTSTNWVPQVTRYQYNLAGQLVTTTIGYGTTQAANMVIKYDYMGRQLQASDANGAVTSNSYASASTHSCDFSFPNQVNLCDYVDLPQEQNNGNHFRQGYEQVSDIDHRVVANLRYYQRNYHRGQDVYQSTEYARDVRGAVISTTINLGKLDYTDDSHYPPLDVWADWKVTAYQSYDLAGHLISKTDANGNSTVYSYDDAGQLQTVTRPLDKAQGISQTVLYDYDVLGGLKTLQDANGHITRYEYDALGRVTKKIWPATEQGNSYEQYFYEDAAGNMTKIRQTDGNFNYFTYDSMQRVSQVTYWDGQVIRYSYTPTGKEDTVTQTVGSIVRVTHYTYDSQDRLKSVNGPDSTQSVSYDYDAVGNRIGITTTAGIVNYRYNSINQLTDVISLTNGSVPQVTHYNYDAADRMISGTLPGPSSTITDPTIIIYKYDLANRMIEENLGAAFSARNKGLYNYEYEWDNIGNRKTVTETSLFNQYVSTRKWSYNDAYWFKNEVWQDTAGVVSTTNYTYDPMGNRLTMGFNTNQTQGTAYTKYAYNALDQLQVITSPLNIQSRYSYDGRGNLAQLNDGSKTNNYSYNALDQLSVITSTNGSNNLVANYQYDWEGHRIQQRIVGGSVPGTTNYLWDEGSQYGDVVLESDGATGNALVSYVLGQNEIIAQNKAGATSYYLKDGQGSVRFLTNGDVSSIPNTTEKYDYDTFGNLQNGPATPASHYLYRGQQYDSSTGLYSLRARYYNPQSGSFVSQDKAEVDTVNPAEINRYTYAANNPTNAFDPSGNNAYFEYDAATRDSREKLKKDEDFKRGNVIAPQTAESEEGLRTALLYAKDYSIFTSARLHELAHQSIEENEPVLAVGILEDFHSGRTDVVVSMNVRKKVVNTDRWKNLARGAGFQELLLLRIGLEIVGITGYPLTTIIYDQNNYPTAPVSIAGWLNHAEQTAAEWSMIRYGGQLGTSTRMLAIGATKEVCWRCRQSFLTYAEISPILFTYTSLNP